MKPLVPTAVVVLASAPSAWSWADVVASNAALVAELNADPRDSAVYALNEFSSLSPTDFRALRLMAKRGAVLPAALCEAKQRSQLASQAPGDLPSSWDWQSLGAVAQVRDQGSVGTCWAFSTAGNIEGQHFIKHGTLLNISTEQLVECDASDDPSGNGGWGCADCGMFGGWPYLAFDYVKDAGGVHAWEEWPYCVSPPRGSGLAQCWPCMAKGYSIQDCGNHASLYCDANTTMGQGAPGLCTSSSSAVAQVTGWLAASDNETEIASALVGSGPLSVLMNAESLQFY